MRRALLFALCLVGCSVDTQGLAQSVPVTFQVTNPESLSFGNPLWVAIVWVGDAGVETTASGPLTFVSAADASVGVATLQMEAPADFAQLGLDPIETLELGAGVPVYRPRLVAYENLTGSTSFVFDGQDAGAGDRVLGVDVSSSLAFVPDIEGMLSSLGATDTDAYYQATGGVFTPYVPVAVDSTTGDLALAPAGPYALALQEGQDSDADLACFRSIRELPFTNVDLVETPATIHVDTGLDPAQVCGTAVAECTSEWLAGASPPDAGQVELDDHLRVTQCEQSGTLESFVVFDAVKSCHGCQCGWNATLDIDVASEAQLPFWWPCGTAVPFCNPPGGFLAVDLTCFHLGG